MARSTPGRGPHLPPPLQPAGCVVVEVERLTAQVHHPHPGPQQDRLVRVGGAAQPGEVLVLPDLPQSAPSLQGEDGPGA